MVFNLSFLLDDEVVLGNGNKCYKFREGEALVARCLHMKIIQQIFPVHDLEALHLLKRTWIKRTTNIQPILDVFNYFGSKIAFYFAWLDHYTTALLFHVIVGLLFWIIQPGRGGKTSNFDEADNGDDKNTTAYQQTFDTKWFQLDGMHYILFAFFNVIWSTSYLKSWKRRSSELAYQWGTLHQHCEILSEPRTLFKGLPCKNVITGNAELHYPEWKRQMVRYFVSVPIIGLCLCVVFAVVLSVLQLQDWWDDEIRTFCFVPKFLLAIAIPVLNKAYQKIALWLNNMENYKTEERHDNNLIIKMALFQFVNSFLALFYTAFYLQDMQRLKKILATILITKQVIGNIKEVLLPFVWKSYKLSNIKYLSSPQPHPGEDNTLTIHDMIAAVKTDIYRMASESILGISAVGEKAGNEIVEQNEDAFKDDDCTMTYSPSGISDSPVHPKISNIECENSLPKYKGTFDEYIEIFIQFGYVTFFSSVYPLAGLFALLNNIFEIRGDAFKLCFTHQRPFAGLGVANIGSWQIAMEAMGVLSIMVNCALIGQLLRLDANITSSTEEVILFVVCLEHLMIFVKVIIAYAVPDIPNWVEKEMAKMEHQRWCEFERATAVSKTQCGVDI